MRKLALAAALAALVGSPIAAGATIIPLTSVIDGLQEVPPVATPATGSATLSFNDVTKLLAWTISYAGLVGTSTDAHFHGPALPGVSALVQVPIPHLNGVTSDTLIGSAILTATQETQLLAGLWYINIHSTFRPGGEIRGQVTVVPEPMTAALLAVGLGGLAVAGRRRN